MLGKSTFSRCGYLEQVKFAKSSRLEEIGSMCFRNNKLRGIVLPKSLKVIYDDSFCDRRNFKKIYVEDGCKVALSDLLISDSV